MANTSNTTKTGDNFELKSLEIIKKVIEEEQLGHLINYLQIFQKKEYYSHKRKGNIKFDLTIEVWPPGANRYVMIYIVECKDYATRVPVNKIEDFHSKLQQVGGVNVKGIFITNSPLQKGGFNFAESVGMMVIQGESSKDYSIILHKTNRNIETKILPILKDSVKLELIDYGVEQIEKIIDKKIINIFKYISSASRVSYNIDNLSKEDIEKIVNEELNKIDIRILLEGKILNKRKLVEYFKDTYELDVINIDGGTELLGFCDYTNNTIGINNSIVGTNRELFVIAHEFGHYILHQKLSIGQIEYDTFEDSKYNFRTGKNHLNNPKHWIEWQANFFASSLLLSQRVVLGRLWICQDEFNKSRGKIYLDDQYHNVKDFRALVDKLSYLFNVSKTSIIYKLEEMELINNQSRLKSVGQIISENTGGGELYI